MTTPCREILAVAPGAILRISASLSREVFRLALIPSFSRISVFWACKSVLTYTLFCSAANCSGSNSSWRDRRTAKAFSLPWPSFAVKSPSNLSDTRRSADAALGRSFKGLPAAVRFKQSVGEALIDIMGQKIFFLDEHGMPSSPLKPLSREAELILRSSRVRNAALANESFVGLVRQGGKMVYCRTRPLSHNGKNKGAVVVIERQELFRNMEMKMGAPGTLRYSFNDIVHRSSSMDHVILWISLWKDTGPEKNLGMREA